MVKPSGPRRSAPEVELCIPVIDEESTKGRRISMMISEHLLTDAPKSPLGPIGRLGDDLHDVHRGRRHGPLDAVDVYRREVTRAGHVFQADKSWLSSRSQEALDAVRDHPLAAQMEVAPHHTHDT